MEREGTGTRPGIWGILFPGFRAPVQQSRSGPKNSEESVDEQRHPHPGGHGDQIDQHLGRRRYEHGNGIKKWWAIQDSNL